MAMRYPGGLIATSPVNAAYPSGVWTQAQTIPYASQNVWQNDQYWPYTTLLLHGDGTNGAQNNTFLDSSTNNFTITRNGNTTQGAFTPFQQSGYWSNYFDGTGDYLTAPNNTAFNIGSGDFTIECWAYITGSSGDLVNYSSGSSNNSQFAFDLYQSSSTQIIAGIFTGSTGYQITVNFAQNTWFHIALVRNGNTMTCYVNGVSGGTSNVTGVTANNPASAVVNIGSLFNGSAPMTGYISNLRIVKGTAVYTSAFTPPTAPLTAITNTQLLTCQSNRFVDNSASPFTLTVYGNTSVQAFQPFPGPTTWSASVLGGSGYFDGSGDYLTAASNVLLKTGTGDCTIEAWVYSAVGGPVVVDGSSGSVTAIYISNGGGNRVIFGAADYPGSGISVIITTSNSVPASAWTHVALVRSSGTFTVYINGVSGGTSANTTDSYELRTIGAIISGGSPSVYFNGYISNARIVKGTAVYTSAFTPPTAPLTNITNTSLLLNFTNAGIFDNAQMNDLETVGNAQVSTSVVKYGTGSMAFDGSGDWLRMPATPNLDMGTGPATVECWLYITAVIQDYRMIVSDATNGNNYITLRGGGTGGRVEINVNGTSFTIDLNNSISLNTWYHFAVVRSGNTFTAYVNGSSLGTGSSSAAWNLGNGGTFVGRFGGATAYEWPGYIDDLRITKGVARYITNFTPPIARMPNQ